MIGLSYEVSCCGIIGLIGIVVQLVLVIALYVGSNLSIDHFSNVCYT